MVLNQTLKCIEVICVDDGSSDNSWAIMQELSANDSRVRVYHKTNGGAASARNLGIENATGEYLFFLDSDDSFYSNDVLFDLYHLAKKHNAEVCGGDLFTITDDDVLTNKTSQAHEGFISFDMFQQDYYFTRFLYMRDTIIDNNLFFPELRLYEDPAFFLNIMCITRGFYYYNKGVYLYNHKGKEGMVACYSNEQLLHYLLGIVHNLQISLDNNWIRLYEKIVYRLIYNLCPLINKRIPNIDDDMKRTLIFANTLINEKYLSNFDEIKDNYVLPPLRLVFDLSERYCYFRNKKVVKVYYSIIRFFRGKIK